jgi:hypothetical protein
MHLDEAAHEREADAEPTLRPLRRAVNISKMSFNRSEGMPAPLSRTSSTTALPSRFAESSMIPCSGV